MSQTEKLLELKQEIEAAKTKAAELTGQLKGYMKTLKDDWGCTTLKQAEKKLKEMDLEIKDLSDKITKGVAELEEKYEL